VTHFDRRQVSFVSIQQGSQELYVLFIDQLQTVMMRQIEQEEAADILLFQLAIENANAERKRSVDPIWQKRLLIS